MDGKKQIICTCFITAKNLNSVAALTGRKQKKTITRYGGPSLTTAGK
jgi:hypothetical protein